MKRAILILLFAPLISLAQEDTVMAKIKQIQTGMIYMRDNLNRAHSQFVTGAGMTLGGIAVASLGAILEPTTNEDGSIDDSAQKATIIGGSVLALVGAIFMIDSHKYIGRAGKWQFTGNTITYKL